MVRTAEFFGWRGGEVGISPVVLAVPHAGRDYPAPLLAAARVSASVLRRLEDRYADLLIGEAERAGYPVLVAKIARACVDLNRDPNHASQRSGSPGARESFLQHEVFPDRITGVGTLWRSEFDPAELAARISNIHRPYHDEIASALAAARARHGRALLIDIHSMPRHAGKGWPASSDIVLSDRRGATAPDRLVGELAASVRVRGLSCARNIPYAGGYGVRTHGRPGEGVHAIQVEIARDLYLSQDKPEPAGIDRIARIVRELADVAVDLLGGASTALPEAAQ